MRKEIWTITTIGVLFAIPILAAAQSSSPQHNLAERPASTIGKAQFPKNYVRDLKAKGELPEWANYVCFDSTPSLKSSYFILVAYSPMPVNPGAAQLGVVKGVTYQEYIEEIPLNKPPTMDEVLPVIANIKNMKAGDSMPERIYNMVTAWFQAFHNLERAGELKTDTSGAAHFVWIAQKHINAVQAGEPDILPRMKLKVDDLGMILYETTPGVNEFRTKTDSAPETATTAEDLIMQPTGEGLFFTFSSYVRGLRTQPTHGKCELIAQEAKQ